MCAGVLTFVVANGERFDPGTRLDCLDALKVRTDDEHVRNALVKAARTDKNAAVRLKALDALRDWTHEAPVRDALLDALHHDANPGVRVEAVNLLVNSLGGGDTECISNEDNLPVVATPAPANTNLRRSTAMVKMLGASCARWKICSGAIRIAMCGCGARRRCDRSVHEICSRRDRGRASFWHCVVSGSCRSQRRRTT